MKYLNLPMVQFLPELKLSSFTMLTVLTSLLFSDSAGGGMSEGIDPVEDCCDIVVSAISEYSPS